MEFAVLNLERVVPLTRENRNVRQHVRRIEQQRTIADGDHVVRESSICCCEVDRHVNDVEQPNAFNADPTARSGNQQRIIRVGKITGRRERNVVLTVRRLQREGRHVCQLDRLQICEGQVVAIDRQNTIAKRGCRRDIERVLSVTAYHSQTVVV